MTNRAKLTGTAAIFVALLSAPAFAAGVSASGDAGVSANAGGASVSTGAGADAGVSADAGSAGASGGTDLTAQAGSDTGNAGAKSKTGAMAGATTYGSLISSYRTGTDFAATVEAAGEDVTVETMTLSELKGEAGENAEALDQAMNDAGDQMDALHSAIEANSDVTAALDAEGYSADDVVAVQSDADGTLQVIVDDRM